MEMDELWPSVPQRQRGGGFSEETVIAENLSCEVSLQDDYYYRKCLIACF